MSDASRMIWVTFRKEGVHCYPAAATDPKLATGDEYDVAFLANKHRHIFHFRVWISVTHNDRDIEFIQFKGQDFDRNLGKGYGVYISLKYLLNNSEYLFKSDKLVIITGRYYITNFRKIIY